MRKWGSDAPLFEEHYYLSAIKPDSKCVLGFDTSQNFLLSSENDLSALHKQRLMNI